MGSDFQRVTAGIRIILENEFGDTQELLDPDNEVDMETDSTTSSKHNCDNGKIRDFALTSWFKTSSDRQKKLQILMDEYKELIAAVERSQQSKEA